MSSSPLLLLLLLLAGSCGCSNAWDLQQWVAYTPGSCNIIISAPHGGSLRDSSIQPRTDGCLAANGSCDWTKGCSPSSSSCRARLYSDSYTKTIADELVATLSSSHSCSPHYVRALLHRSRLDANRDMPEAAQGDPAAQAAWLMYHDSLAAAVGSVRQQFGSGLLLDIHGQTHEEGWNEIGVLLSRYDLNNNRLEMNRSSIRGLGSRSPLPASALISGPSSLGGLLQARGHVSVPSPQHPSPGAGNFFSGGYTTRRHGSIDGGLVDAVQLEVPAVIRKDSTRRLPFARDVAASLAEFRLLHGYA